ncbi:ankyrin repeat domain-containing protein [bacterium]|nr:ankyrin repeat domain-containing protein [bacterium]
MDAAHEMIEALKAGQLETIKTLVVGNPSLIDAKTPTGESTYLLAAYYGRREILDFLLSFNPQLSVFEAAAIGKIESVRAHAETNSGAVHAFSHDGFTALHLAAYFGHKEIVRWLLDHGANPNAASRNPMQVQPIHSAAAARHLSIVAMLIENGADVNARQHGGYTPLHSAAANGQSDMIELLIQNGADVNTRTDDGKSAIKLALEKNHPEIAGLLRRHGAFD